MNRTLEVILEELKKYPVDFRRSHYKFYADKIDRVNCSKHDKALALKMLDQICGKVLFYSLPQENNL